jgi:uncharacterized membrane protein
MARKKKKMSHKMEEMMEEKIHPGIHKKMVKAGKKAARKLKKDIKIGKKESKVEKVMHEYKEDKLRSGSKKGPKVSNPKQAIAIALSEARKAGEPVKKKMAKRKKKK